MDGSPSSLRKVLPLIAAVSVLLLAHALLFAAYVRREIAWAYAPNFDQTTSLRVAYHTYEYARVGGLARGYGYVVSHLPPNGALINLEATLLFAVLGPSRLVALGVNWLHFALLLASMSAALWDSRRRWDLPLFGLGLVLCLNLPYYWVGGLDDFRPDFAAFCLYGTFLAAVWRAQVFRRPRWSVAAGVVAGLSALTRPLTSVYLCGLLGLCLAVLLPASRWRPDPAERADRRRQVRGTLLCAAAMALTALPLVSLQARRIWAYYADPARAVWATRTELGPYLLYYPLSALRDHAGTLFLSLAAGGIAVLLASRWLARARADGGEGAPPDAGRFMTAALVVPLATLTVVPPTSPVVGGLLMAPFAWMVLALCARLARLSPPAAMRMAAVVTLLSGIAWQGAHLLGPGTHHAPLEAKREVDRLHDDLMREVDAAGWAVPRILADRQRDWLPALQVSVYERYGRLLEVKRALGARVLPATADEIMEELRRSDLVIVTRAGGPLFLPYDESMAAHYPRLLAWCKRNLRRVGTYRVEEDVILFARTGPADDARQTSTLTP